VALAQNGFANAVATLGTACTADHLTKLFRFTDSVVFSFDGDKAGRRAAARALEAALPHATDLRSVKFLFLPAEHDPDSYVRELGAPAFEEAMAAAVPLSQQLLEQAADDADLETAEGRARMLAQAKPLWMALPEGALRRQLLPELARRAALSVDDLHALWGAQNAAKRGSGGPGGGGNSSPPWNGLDDLPNEDFSAYDVGHEDAGAWSGDPGGASARPTATDRNGGWPTDGRGDSGRRGGGKWSGGGGGGDWKGKGGKWSKTPAGPFDHLPRPPKQAPAAGADLVLRLLLRHSSWWEQLSSDDHHLLHGLGGPHGEALAWLERQLMEHGPQPWSVLLEALATERFAAQARAWVGDGSIEESHELADLQRVVHRLWVDHLVQAVGGLIAEGRTDREQLDRIAALNAAIKQHREAQAALGQGKPLP
jgi:DNA primase